MNAETENPQLASFRAKAVDKSLSESALKEAAGIPMPGPLADAFAVQPDIEVGKYKVRPFYDLDFDILQSLGHPLCQMAETQDFGKTLHDYRGEKAWHLCWLFTHTVDEADQAYQAGQVRDLARKEFSRLQLGGLVAITKAVIEQYGRYFSTLVGLEAGAGGEPSQKKIPRTSLNGDGSSTSDARSSTILESASATAAN